MYRTNVPRGARLHSADLRCRSRAGRCTPGAGVGLRPAEPSCSD